MCRNLIGCRWWLVFLLAAGVVGFSLGEVAWANDIAADAVASRQKLVDDIGAIESAALRAKLLDAAQAEAGEPSLAHWYAAEVFRNGRWNTLKEAQQQAAEDVDLIAYQQRRNQVSNTAGSHEKMARWCQKKGLTELAHMHWLYVLRFQPNHSAALGVLELRWHNGLLLAEEEIAAYQENQRQRLRDIKRWRTKAKRIRRTLEHGDLPQQKAAREELWAIRDEAAVPALVEEFTEEGPEEQTTVNRRFELIEVLGNIDAPEATETLVRFAVESSRDPIRYAALDQLTEKPMEEYVPVLLEGMRMPVEASVSIRVMGKRIVSSFSYAQEGHTGQEYRRQRSSSYVIPGQRYNSAPTYATRRVPERVQEGYTVPERVIPAYQCNDRIIPERRIPERYIPPLIQPAYDRTERAGTVYSAHEKPEFQYQKQRALRSSQAAANRETQRIGRLNAAIEQQNAQIAEVLAEATGETFSAFPKSWWNWWSDHLERHPESATLGARQQWSLALLNKNPRGLSRGTWVWTLGGRVAVETVRPGDFVLSQDPATGELAYQVVLAIASPRNLPVSKIQLEQGALHCVPGQVVWTAGRGWQRVSKLAEGESLHGVRRSARVGQVADAFTIDCYDLIVDKFHTLFIGESGVLVHDATPVKSTHAALPGFSPAAVADAAHLASAP